MEENTKRQEALNKLKGIATPQEKPVEEKPIEETPGGVKPEEQKPEGTQQTPAAELNFADIFGEGYGSAEAVKGALSEYGSLREEKSQWDDMKQQYEAKLAEKSNPFVNDEVYKLNELVRKTGGNDFEVLSKVVSGKLDGMSDLDKIVMRRIYENPEFKGKESLVVEMIKDELRMNESFNEDDYEDEYEKSEAKREFEKRQEIAKMKLTSLANQSTNFFTELTKDIQVPEKVDVEAQMKQQTEEYQKNTKELAAGWGQLYDKATGSFNKLNLSIPGKDGLVNFMDYETDREFLQNIKDEVVDFMATNQLEFNEDNLKFLRDMVSNRYIIDNLPQIFKAVVGRSRELSTEQYDELYNNPSALKNNDTKPEGGLSRREKAI